MIDITKYAARSGRIIKENGSIVNEADGINDDGSPNVAITGSYVRLSTEPKPTTGVKDGNDLLLVDTGQVFVYYKGQWREI